MEKIRRFICILIPNTKCNFKCQYCYLQHSHIEDKGSEAFKFPPETFRKAFSRARMGGTCMVNFTAHGETMLSPQLPDYVRVMLEEGHFVEVVTNATITKAIEKFLEFPKELLSHLMFKCSFHWAELKKRNLLQRFFLNVKMARAAGASITVELMPHDEILSDIDEIIETTTKEIGAPSHVTVGRDASCRGSLPLLTKLSRDDYKNAWSRFDSKLFEYKLSVFEKKQLGFCYAGDWMFVLDIGSGLISQCYQGYKTIRPFEDVEKPVRFSAIGNCCPEPHCYNAHAWLTFGCCPTADAPYYDEVRNRKCVDGSEWLTPEVKAFFHQKFQDTNSKYSFLKRFLINCEMRLRRGVRERRIWAQPIRILFLTFRGVYRYMH